MSTTPEGLTIEKVKITFGSKTIVSDVSFQLEKGSLGCLLGPSGCGKTSLLRSIAGFIKPQCGSIKIGNQKVCKKNFVPPEKRNVGLVFQDYALFPHLSVRENIAFGLKTKPKNLRDSRIEEVLKLTKMTEHADRFPNQLSGGQQQRVAIARALAPEPSVLLLDEPFSHLDAALREEVAEEIKSMLKKANVTTLVVTHNQSEVFDLADYVGIIHDGKLLQWGSLEQIYHLPEHQRVAELFGKFSFLKVGFSNNRWQSALFKDKELQCAHNTCDITKETLLLRPDQIKICQEGRYQGKVVASKFRGHYSFVDIEIPGGEVLTGLFPGTFHQKVSDSIRFDLDLSQSVLL